jgi:hypothetical protein
MWQMKKWVVLWNEVDEQQGVFSNSLVVHGRQELDQALVEVSRRADAGIRVYDLGNNSETTM